MSHKDKSKQPSGVVMPERKTWNQVTGREGFIETEAHNACLDEVARLNSSPVSAGDVLTSSECACGDQYPANSYGAGFMAANNGVCENCDASAPSHGEQVREGWQLVPVEPTDAMLEAGDKYIGTPATYKSMLSACPSPAITKDFSQFLSAVMDAAGLIRHGRQSKELSEYLGMKCMEYRGAALSAPSHGEQVREVVPVPLVPTDEMLNAGKSMLHKSNGRGAREKCGRIFAAMLAAVPSAGSQKEQGE